MSAGSTLQNRLLCAFAALLLSGCWSSSPNEVVVYCALDSEFAEPILQQYERETGVRVLTKTDVEANKTVGLAQSLIAERDHPRCDVFWNNEILHTCRLEKLGLLQPIQPPHALAFPAEFRSAHGTWYGFAARARVLLVNTDLVAPADRPTSIRDLTAKRWRGNVAMARPLFGTTATHAACLWATWGADQTKSFFRDIRANEAKILPGNKQVARAVSDGQVAFGLTDTDDAIIEIAAKRPVVIVYPDQEPSSLGTLYIPNTLAVLKNGPHAANAEPLVNYLLAPQVEEQLATGESAQIPLNPQVKITPRVASPRDVRPMQVDFAAAAEAWEAAATFLRDEFAK